MQRHPTVDAHTAGCEHIDGCHPQSSREHRFSETVDAEDVLEDIPRATGKAEFKVRRLVSQVLKDRADI